MVGTGFYLAVVVIDRQSPLCANQDSACGNCTVRLTQQIPYKSDPDFRLDAPE
jgi:hypothetical protein